MSRGPNNWTTAAQRLRLTYCQPLPSVSQSSRVPQNPAAIFFAPVSTKTEVSQGDVIACRKPLEHPNMDEERRRITRVYHDHDPDTPLRKTCKEDAQNGSAQRNCGRPWCSCA